MTRAIPGLLLASAVQLPSKVVVPPLQYELKGDNLTKTTQMMEPSSR